MEHGTFSFGPTEEDILSHEEYPYHETHEQILASIREAVAEIEAGIPGLPIADAFAKIRAELDLALAQVE